MLHLHLWPAVIGTLLGAILLVHGLRRYVGGWTRGSRRERLLVGAPLGLFAAAYLLNVYAWLVEPRLLIVREVELTSSRWHGAPLRIVLVGDTHVGGPHTTTARIEGVVDRINALAPEIVFLLGDYVAGHEARSARTPAENAAIEEGLAAFNRLQAPLGVVAVLGNHDVWYDAGRVQAALERANVDVLSNGMLTRVHAGKSFAIAGLEDAMTGNPDFKRTFASAETHGAIVLSHSPDPFPEMPEAAAIMLAAHTHCGQVTVPFVGRPVVPSHYGERYACGTVVENGRLLFVTGGVGTSIVPVRFLNPPEIVVLTLRSSAESSSAGY